MRKTFTTPSPYAAVSIAEPKYLLKKKSEVKLFLLAEFDEELFAETMREEGRKEGEERLNRLYLVLMKGQKSRELDAGQGLPGHAVREIWAVKRGGVAMKGTVGMGISVPFQGERWPVGAGDGRTADMAVRKNTGQRGGADGYRILLALLTSLPF